MLKRILSFVVVLILLYHSISAIRWIFVHPKANSMTTITYIGDMWAWRTITQFQDRE